MPHVINRHILFWALFSRSYKNIRHVITFQVISLKASRCDCKPSVNTLAARPAVPLCFGFENRVRAGTGFGNQLGKTALRDDFDHFGFGLKAVGIVYSELAPNNGGTQALQEMKSNGMCSARSAGTQYFIGNWEVEAHNAVLEEPDASRLD